MHLLLAQTLILKLLALAIASLFAIDAELLRPPPRWVRNDSEDGDYLTR